MPMTFTLKRSRIDKLSPDAILAELRRVAKHYDFQYFTGRQFDRVAVNCKKTTVINNFGSWEAALRAAGLASAPTRKPRKDLVPETELFAELERVWRLKGHRPSRTEWEASNPRFSYTTYKTRFKGWTNACVRFIEFKSGEPLTGPTSSHVQAAAPSESNAQIPPSRRRNIPDRLRLRVLIRDGFSCVYCGRSPATERGVSLHMDHKIPFSAGGETVFENLQTLCQKCNLGKGDAKLHHTAF